MSTDTLNGISAAAPSIAMLGMFACTAGGVYLLARGRERKRAVLMLVMAVVLLANVLIWTL